MQRIQHPTLSRAVRELLSTAPLPPLAPYPRCTCGSCCECRENARWDRIFAKFETKAQEERGFHRCALEDL
jgi:hypothetical protein